MLFNAAACTNGNDKVSETPTKTADEVDVAGNVTPEDIDNNETQNEDGSENQLNGDNATPVDPN